MAVTVTVIVGMSQGWILMPAPFRLHHQPQSLDQLSQLQLHQPHQPPHRLLQQKRVLVKMLNTKHSWVLGSGTRGSGHANWIPLMLNLSMIPKPHIVWSIAFSDILRSYVHDSNIKQSSNNTLLCVFFNTIFFRSDGSCRPRLRKNDCGLGNCQKAFGRAGDQAVYIGRM